MRIITEEMGGGGGRAGFVRAKIKGRLNRGSYDRRWTPAAGDGGSGGAVDGVGGHAEKGLEDTTTRCGTWNAELKIENSHF